MLFKKSKCKCFECIQEANCQTIDKWPFLQLLSILQTNHIRVYVLNWNISFLVDVLLFSTFFRSFMVYGSARCSVGSKYYININYSNQCTCTLNWSKNPFYFLQSCLQIPIDLYLSSWNSSLMKKLFDILKWVIDT